MKIAKLLILALLSISPICEAFSQERYIVEGKIFDNSDKLTLPQAHVIVLGSDGASVVSDMDGNYRVAVVQKEVTLIFRYVGYKEVEKKIKFSSYQPVVLNVGMDMSSNTLKGFEVVNSRYRTDNSTSIQTLEIIGIKHIDRVNATTLDQALNNVAGLAIVDNEPQMRGGSGFSSGMGSRVMILLDEMPILRADAGRPAWNLIPMEDVSQIEVLKGASSVLFGSAAINGAINVRTSFAKNEPETKAKIYAGAYGKPKQKELAPWNDQNPLLFGASLSHSRKSGKVDVTFGAEYATDDGYRGPDNKRDPANIVNKGNEVVNAERRFRTNLGLVYNINKYWKVGLNTNFLFSDNNQHHFWYNASTDLYRAYPGTLSHFKDLMLFFDPSVKYISPQGGTHTFKNRLLFSDNRVVNYSGQDASSQTYFNEYQYKKTMKKAADVSLVVGATNQYARSYGSVFSGNTVDIGVNGEHFANNFAVYATLEKTFLAQKNLTLNFGGRWEFCKIDDFFEEQPVFQFGANYEFKKTYTFLRASVGQGYRAATIGERYITTVVGNYGFFPNPELQSETSVNTEIAVKQMFKIGSFEGFVDLAGFRQTYDNYIEFCMGPWRNTIKPNEKFGFKFFNTGPAVINGYEATLAGQGKVSQWLEYQFQVAYTYSLPRTTDPDYVYTTTSSLDYTYKNSAYRPEDRILKYRIQHLGKGDLNLKFAKYFVLGFSAQYFSQMKNLDRVFMDMDKESPYALSWVQRFSDLPFEGMYNFMEKHKNGAWVFGLRAGWESPRLSFSILFDNILNREYALRPLCIEPPRHVTIQVSYKFTEINPGRMFNRQSSMEDINS